MGGVYNVLKSAYTSNYYSVKTCKGTTDSFSTGMKQGCNLSPTLSNIYQIDLHSIFDHCCDPVSLDGHDFSSMSWADDLVLISQTSRGLQMCMNKLENYCEQWGLTVNVDKTKIMVMSKGKM